MRMARIKHRGGGCYYHLTNRTAGSEKDRPFGKVEKKKFENQVHSLSTLYSLQVVTLCVMCNHFHLTLFVPGEPPSRKEAARRYNKFYKDRHPITADSPIAAELAPRLNDISHFMHDLQQRFTVWFNKSRPIRRRGALWAGRFKSVILQRGMTLWNAIKYIILNPVRAKMVNDPADYRFSDWGHWHESGRHPFESNFVTHVCRSLGHRADGWDAKRLQSELRTDLARTMAADADANAIQAACESGKKRPAPILRADRRNRCWSDGAIIGDRQFVHEVAGAVYGSDAIKKKRLGSGRLPDSGELLYSFRRLRKD